MIRETPIRVKPSAAHKQTVILSEVWRLRQTQSKDLRFVRPTRAVGAILPTNSIHLPPNPVT
jgi:hypothetical protein